MHLVTYTRRHEAAASARVGLLLEDGVIDLAGAFAALGASASVQAACADMPSFLRAGAGVLTLAKAACDALSGATVLPQLMSTLDPLEAVRLLAPLPAPGKLICAWVNYRHANTPQFAQPMFFNKFASTIIGPGDAILLPEGARQTIVEAELAVVIGKDGKNIAEDDAFGHIAGYTIVNDVTALDYRLEALLGVVGPYMMGKCIDTFAPMGPAIVTPDEVSDPQDLRVRYWVNDDMVLDGRSSGMIFSIAQMIAYLSRFFWLRAGDVIATGSPVNLAMPPKARPFLAPGDRVRIAIEGIGSLENSVGLA